MNPLFARQLRRRLGVEDPESIDGLLAALVPIVEAAAPGTPLADLVARLPGFLQTVEQTYAQSERDQALRNRSMAISSGELSEANQRLREASARQQGVIDAMRAAADRMLLAAGKEPLGASETSLESLSSTVVELVQDRENTRRRLADSESRFRGLTAISSDWYWEQDHEHRYLFVSAGADTLKTSAREFIGLRRWESADSVIDPVRLALHKADLDARRPFRDFEYQIIDREGELRWVSTSGDPLYDEAGEFQGYRGTGKDITERKHAEAQIAENLRLIEALLESIPDAIMIRDRLGRTTRINPAFQRLFAPAGTSWIGADELPAALATPEQLAAETRLLAEGGEHRCQVQVDRQQEAPSVFLVQRAAFARDDGEIAGIVTTLTDISELEHTRRQALIAQRTAEHAMKVRAQFLANMSHEVRTPMNGVLGIAGLLQDTPLNDSQRELVGLLQTSGRALLTILNDILDFSKIEAGKVRLERTEFDLHAAIRGQMALFAATARDQRLTMALEIAPDVPQWVCGDPTRIGQVLSNLIGNALKFTAAGRVDVRVERVDADNPELVRFSVSDTGVGIDPAVQAKIFDAFSQADDSTTRRFGGTGLGLAICRELVTLMGGEIRVDSRLGEGSRFWFTVRLGPGSRAPMPAQGIGGRAFGESTPDSAVTAPPGSSPTAAVCRGRVLLAEDNEVNQRVARTMIKALGYEVVVVSDGEAAIQAASSERFDLILMDCHMPGTDGFQATATLRRQEAGSSGERRVIVAQTAMAMQGDREQCLAAGMDDYITKPFTRADLQRTLARWIPDRADTGA